MIRREQGYTLVELLIVMAIFIVVIMLTGQSFNSILTSASRLFKSEQSSTEGIVGLENLRRDLNQAGFGLATESGVSWTGEAVAGKSQTLNDPFSGPPRPIAVLERSPTAFSSGCTGSPTDQADDQGYTLISCSDYLAIKATNLGISPASRKWTYLSFESHSVAPKEWTSAADNLASGDSVALVRKWVQSDRVYSTLVPDVTGRFYHAFGKTAFSRFTTQSAATMNTYGVDAGPLRMPFNRADYFVAKPPSASDLPPACAPGTGILYRAMLNHSNGKLSYTPVMDCVANMQVVFGWDTDKNGLIDTWSNADGSQLTGVASKEEIANALSTAGNDSALKEPSIRNSLKMIKVYILAQNGTKDSSYTSPSPIIVGDKDLGEMMKTFSFDVAAAGLLNYRWKLYSLVTTPKNLSVNE